MEKVAACRSLVSYLAGGARQQRLRQSRVAGPDYRIGGEIAIADLSADMQSALLGRLDAVKSQTADVDEMLRPLDAQLHQVQEIGASCDETCRRPARHSRNGRFHCVCPLIGEGLHAS